MAKIKKIFIVAARILPFVLIVFGAGAVLVFTKGIQKLDTERKYAAQLSQSLAHLSKVPADAPYEVIAIDVPEYAFGSSTIVLEESKSAPSAEEEIARASEAMEPDFESGAMPVPVFEIKKEPPREKFDINSYPDLLERARIISADAAARAQNTPAERSIYLSHCAKENPCFTSPIVIEQSNAFVDCGGITLQPRTIGFKGLVIRASNVTVAHCTFEGFGVAITVEEGALQTNILENTFKKNGTGIVAASSQHVVFGNEFREQSSDALVFSGSGNTSLKNTFVYNQGTSMMVSADNFIAKNTIENNSGAGMEISGNNNTMFDNAVRIGANDSGIMLANANGNQIIGNIIAGNSNGRGIYITDGSNNALIGNMISGNGKEGIDMSGFSENNIVRLNEIWNNGSACSVRIPNGNIFELNILDKKRCF